MHELRNFSTCASAFFQHAAYCQIYFPYSCRRSRPVQDAPANKDFSLLLWAGRANGGRGVQNSASHCAHVVARWVCGGTMLLRYLPAGPHRYKLRETKNAFCALRGSRFTCEQAEETFTAQTVPDEQRVGSAPDSELHVDGLGAQPHLQVAQVQDGVAVPLL